MPPQTPRDVGAENLMWMLGVEDAFSKPLNAIQTSVGSFMTDVDRKMGKVQKTMGGFSEEMDVVADTGPVIQQSLSSLGNAMAASGALAAVAADQTDEMAEAAATAAAKTEDQTQQTDHLVKKLWDWVFVNDKVQHGLGKVGGAIKKTNQQVRKSIFSLEEFGLSWQKIAGILAGITVAGLIIGFFRKIIAAEEEMFQRYEAWQDALISAPAAARPAIRSLASLEWQLGTTNEELAELAGQISDYYDLTKVTEETGRSMRQMAMMSLQASRAMNISAGSAWQLLVRLRDMNKLGPEAAQGLMSAFDAVADATSLTGEQVAEMGGAIAKQMSFIQRNLEETLGVEAAKTVATESIAELTAIGGAFADVFGEGVDLSTWLERLRDEVTRSETLAAMSHMAGVPFEAFESAFMEGDIAGILMQSIKGAKIREEDIGIDAFRREYGTMAEHVGISAEAMEQITDLSVSSLEERMAAAVAALSKPLVPPAKATMSGWAMMWKQFDLMFTRFWYKIGEPFMDVMQDLFPKALKKLEGPLMNVAKWVSEIDFEGIFSKWWRDEGEQTFVAMKIIFWKDIIPALTHLKEKVADFIQWWSALDDKSKKWYLRLGLLTGGISLFVDVIGIKGVFALGKFGKAMIPIFKGLKTGISLVTWLGRSFFLLTGPIGLVIAAIAAVAVGLELLGFNWGKAWKMIKYSWEYWTGDLLPKVWKGLKTVGQFIWDYVLYPWRVTYEAIWSALKWLGSVIYDVIIPALKDMGLPVSGLSELLDGVIKKFGKVGEVVEEIGGFILSVFETEAETEARLTRRPIADVERDIEARQKRRAAQRPELGGIPTGMVMPAMPMPAMAAMAVPTAAPIPAEPIEPEGPVDINDDRMVDVLEQIKNVLVGGFGGMQREQTQRTRRPSVDDAMIRSIAPAE